MYSTRTRRRRRRSGCNANANTMTKFKHTTGRILRTPLNGPTLTKVTYFTIPKSSKHEPMKSMSPKTKKNKKSKGAIIGGRRSKRLGRSRDGRFVGWYHETFRHRLGCLVGGVYFGWVISLFAYFYSYLLSFFRWVGLFGWAGLFVFQYIYIYLY